MERLLGEAMDAGAFGFSTGLVYAPSAYARHPELIALARSMARRGGYYFSHIRGESSMLLDSIREAIRIGEEGGVGVQISHVKASGTRELAARSTRALRLIETARARGVDVAGDVYPYNAGSTKMDNLMPAWAHDGRHRRSSSSGWPTATTRRRIVEECLSTASAGAPSRRAASDSTRSSSPPAAAASWRGSAWRQLARQSGKTPAEALMNLLLEQKCTVGMVSFSQSIENVAKVLAHPAAHDRLRLHPALRGRGRPARASRIRARTARSRACWASTRASGGCSRWRPRSTR